MAGRKPEIGEINETGWNKVFEHAHEFSWPTASLSIQDVVFKRCEDEILEAASKHGYRVISCFKARIVSFLKG